jgi:CBS-domain-containing membrane protein
MRWEVVEMGQGRGFKEALSSFIATVFPTDTLLGALKVMDRHHVRLVGVVGAEGRLVGVVHETQLLAAWRLDPLAQVADVMARVRRSHEVRIRTRRLARLYPWRSGGQKPS